MKVLVTGVTGMVGEGVLHECLNDSTITEVLVINRKNCGTTHSKLKEITHSDFFNFTELGSKIAGYDACFFCLGVSSVGLNEEEFYKKTYTLTTHFAQSIIATNPNMVFCYISGAGTDSSENGKTMWARVKGKTENDLLKMPFKKVYVFRPGMLHPTPGLKNTLKYYKYLGWLYPILKLVAPNIVSTLKELGLAMINSVKLGYEKSVIEVKDIIILSKK